MIQIDRRHFIASLGGAAAVKLMSFEAKAEALEAYMMAQLNNGTAQPKRFPKAAEIEAQIETRNYRRGVGNLFLTTQPNGKVKKLEPMPAKPMFLDFFKLRMQQTSNHVLQSANRAMKTGMTEEIILACLLHDTVHALIKVDHGYWGAQLYGPYVPEKVAFALNACNPGSKVSGIWTRAQSPSRRIQDSFMACLMFHNHGSTMPSFSSSTK